MENNQSFVVDADAANFAELVLANSRKGPVLVNFWSPKAGPCLKLWPVLQTLVDEFSGKFLLVNVNTDRESQLARQYGVTSIPNVKLFRNQKVIDQVLGADIIDTYRSMLQKHLGLTDDPVIISAIRLYREGNIQQAFELLEKALEQSQNQQILLTYIKLLVQQKQYARVLEILGDIPENRLRNDELANLRVHCEWMLVAEQPRDPQDLREQISNQPGNPELRLRYATELMRQDAYEQALEQLLEICSIDREFHEDIGRRSMLFVFHILGAEHPLTQDYRARLQRVLESGR